MRIIAGLYRGRRLKTLPGLQLRPTPDRLRQSLFDILGASIQDSVFIDVYAGSGAVGIETISRGARRVFFVEENVAACRIIHGNLTSLGVAGQAEVLCSDAISALRALDTRGIQADFCFLDPPYEARQQYVKSIRIIAAGHLVKPAGLVIVQHSKRESLDDRAERLRRFRVLAQGSNALSFYRFEDSTRQSEEE
ncbi:MAG: 16S rRNA (guanine(966)-N(2))-methyltransferase RsmD [Acidobacteria bacterium]|nr:16S rRNA (guanine(966)-N(2))-methyltransferase RsmD [Acidobacteriota bacterium]